MNCDKCGRPMTLLFVTAVCDWCEGNLSGGLHRGWVLWTGTKAALRYVFRTAEDAERYRRASNLAGCTVRPVLCESPFSWKPSRGTVKDIEVADTLYEVFPTRDFPYAENHAFLDVSAA